MYAKNEKAIILGARLLGLVMGLKLLQMDGRLKSMENMKL
jgi:hypothetical protein